MYCDQITKDCKPMASTSIKPVPIIIVTFTGNDTDCPNGDCNTSTVSTRSPVQNEFVYSGTVCNDRDKVCMTGYFCSNGQCLPELNIPNPDAFNPCDQLRCPQGTQCDTNTGMCEQFRPIQPPVGPVCPDNSHYVACGSPCPRSCTNDGCNLPCIPTCQCNTGFTQASKTDTRCIPDYQCSLMSGINFCLNQTCPANHHCIEGYCNANVCPDIVKPSIRNGCSYVLSRNVNNCLMFDLDCEPNVQRK
ncbi:hypothetical protein WR25_26542 [Diploscapter pachys]|uniref:TIL domain-containing protein n=1 Tax=Diploscapter pachys TaxID=2018661 RepID=A0A2A2LIL3_9BILA|nr:hypothetical protein WR25_26542 [Diploscapter pachys]